jgi:hypothetical protein
MMELAAARIGPASLKVLRACESDLYACIEDTRRFVNTWQHAVVAAFAGTRNPALAVIAEILQWVRAGTQEAVTMGANAVPAVVEKHRTSQALLSELLSALTDGDAPRAGKIWAECVSPTVRFIESSELGQRLIVDIIE